MIKRLYHSTLLKSAGIYTISGAINSGIPFLMLPILTRYLTPIDYGILAMFSVLLGLSRPFIGLNLHGAISVKYFDRKSTDLPRYIGNTFFLLIITSMIASLVLWIYSDTISRFTAFPKEWLWAIILISFGQFVILALMTLWQAGNSPLKYGIFQNLQTLINIGLSILLVIGLGESWEGRIEAQIATFSIFSIVAFIVLYRNLWIKFTYDRSCMSHALKFGIPLIPHALGGVLIAQTDRIFITNMTSISETGIYTVGFQIAYIVALVTSSFNQAYVPWLFGQLSSNQFAVKLRIVKFTYIAFGFIALLAICVALLSPWFLEFFVGSEFVDASKYIPWLASAFAFSSMYYLVANYIFYSAKTHLLGIVTFSTALINVVLNYVLIKQNGAVGAAQASAASFFVMFILTWLLSAKVFKMPWRLKRTVHRAV